jgi:DNA-binding response OmpR family regulator
MNHGPHVLIVSRDQMLLQSRALILGTYFQVEAAGRVPEAESAMAKISFDLVVLCSSLPDDEYLKMMDICRRQAPQPKILVSHADAGAYRRVRGDGAHTVDGGPYELLKKSAELIGYPLKPTGRAAQHS